MTEADIGLSQLIGPVYSEADAALVVTNVAFSLRVEQQNVKRLQKRVAKDKKNSRTPKALSHRGLFFEAGDARVDHETRFRRLAPHKLYSRPIQRTPRRTTFATKSPPLYLPTGTNRMETR